MKKETDSQRKNREYEESINKVSKLFTWEIVKRLTIKEMTDAVEELEVNRIIMPTAKSTGKSRFVAIYILYMFYYDYLFNAAAGRKKKIDNPKIINIVKNALIEIEEMIDAPMMHHFEFQTNMITTKIIFKRKYYRTEFDQTLDFFSFDQPDSVAGLTPSRGYYGVLWLEEPVQQRDTSGVTHEEYMLTYLTLVDTLDRFAIKHKKRFIIFATMNGWDDRHYFIKRAEELMPWDDFIDFASKDFLKNNIKLVIKDKDAIIRATQYSNPIIKGNQEKLDKIQELMTYDEGRAIVLGQVVETDQVEDFPYLSPLSHYSEKEIFKLSDRMHEIEPLDTDYGYDHGNYAAEVIAEVILYADENRRLKLHFNAVFFVWNEQRVKYQKLNRLEEPEIEDLAAEWLKSRKRNWFEETTIAYDFADKTSMRNILNQLTKKYNVNGLEDIEYTDKNVKGKFDVFTREQKNLSALNHKLITFDPEVFALIDSEEVGQPWRYLCRNGKINIDKLDKKNKDDILEAFERAARHHIDELGEKYEQHMR